MFAAGAVFTIPAFVVLGLWKFTAETMWTEYLTASALMILGGILVVALVLSPWVAASALRQAAAAS